ncbi:MAG: tRNA preQ1(34) S-adenosylmethionine ribosyltransferase-isomerase QueA [Clostridium sp.]|nr:tRNA preQ1(34) S-adenosylmethionine ribosyltransferase-isomerase QueA [Clostridium sp.]
MLKVKDFNYDLPEELIAQHPLTQRDASKLMLINKETGEIEHKIFKDLPHLIEKGDLLVLNDTRVLPARLLGVREETGGHVELLLLRRVDLNTWETLAKPGKSARPGRIFSFGNGTLRGEIIEVKEDGNRLVRFHYDGVFEEILDKLGEMPLPPYIHEKLEDKERYQTVYSKEEGSAAAPTAGLHFTPELLDELRGKGAETAFITLHVGLGTFRPVKVEKIDDHLMHSEYYSIDETTAQVIEKARQAGRRIISVGTTTTRTLETVMRDRGKIESCSGWTDIFIYPGFEFKIVDSLITNFHLPESTLIMLVSALLGHGATMAAYEEAVKEKYRFFSFGDSMFIKSHGLNRQGRNLLTKTKE